MNKEEVKDLINDMWKDELSKSGKFRLEEYIRKLRSKQDEIKKYCEESAFDVSTREYGTVTVVNSEDILEIIGVDTDE